MNNLKTGQLYYLAGLFDGEGCISITRHVVKQHGTVSHALRVGIGMSHEGVIRTIHKWIGVGAVYHDTRSKRKSLSDAWYLWLSTRDAHDFLEALLPHLIVKRAEAEIALEFNGVSDKRSEEGCGRNKSQSRETIAERDSLKAQLSDLKGASSRNKK